MDSTANFTVAVSGQSITAKTKTEAYANTLSGKTVQLVFGTLMKKGTGSATLAAHGHYDAARTNISFKNTGSVGYKTYDGEGQVTGEQKVSTNEVETVMPLPVWPAPQKRVSDADETSVLKNTVTSRLESWSYSVSAAVPAGWTYDSITVSDNTPEVEDDNTVHIGEAVELEVEKAADCKTYEPGDTVKYTVIAKCVTEGKTAENVVFTDLMDKKGVLIDEASIKVVLDGEDITEKCEITAISN